jgi:hypothetical protein
MHRSEIERFELAHRGFMSLDRAMQAVRRDQSLVRIDVLTGAHLSSRSRRRQDERLAELQAWLAGPS